MFLHVVQETSGERRVGVGAPSFASALSCWVSEQVFQDLIGCALIGVDSDCMGDIRMNPRWSRMVFES